MIVIIVKFFILLAVAALSHYILIDKILNPIITVFQSMFPTAYNATTVIVIDSILHWLLLFVIIGGTYYVLVEAQRSKTPEGYYA